MTAEAAFGGRAVSCGGQKKAFAKGRGRSNIGSRQQGKQERNPDRAIKNDRGQCRSTLPPQGGPQAIDSVRGACYNKAVFPVWEINTGMKGKGNHENSKG